MLLLYELEIRDHITYTVHLCKVEKGTPSRQTNFQKESLPSNSLIQATGLGQRSTSRMSACIYAVAESPYAGHFPGDSVW